MKFLIPGAVALALTTSIAHAANVSSPAETLAVVTGKNSLAFDNTFAHVAAGDVFNDRFGFTLTGESDLRFTVTSTAVGKNFSLDLTGFSLYNAATQAIVAPGKLNYLNANGGYDKWTLIANDLAAGSYYLQVSGTLLAQGGSYASNGVITVSPVPEPAAPLMLLGGLAAIAVVTRRKAH